jgi:hypothetical protein
MDIRIDRLRVQVTGMNPDMARQFGRLLAEHLAAVMAAGPPMSGDAARLTSLRVSVPGSAGRNPGSLAPAMATEVSRALRTAATDTAMAGTAATVRTMPATGPGAAR